MRGSPEFEGWLFINFCIVIALLIIGGIWKTVELIMILLRWILM